MYRPDKRKTVALIYGGQGVEHRVSCLGKSYVKGLIDKEKYKDYILSDIDTRCKMMLDEGATTFWETELGANDFEGAGSLCHGWSAMPIYYYNILL